MNKFHPVKLIYARKKNKMTQKTLANILNISDRTVSKWEKGLAKPSSKNLLKLSRIFGVPVESFFEENSINTINTIKKDITGMESLKELYKIGRGPSSSHTIGPEKACMLFKQKNSDADSFKATLYGSLAKTGKGHCTDVVIKQTFMPYNCDVEFDLSTSNIPHPNTMMLIAYKNKAETDRVRVFSIGGGSIQFEKEKLNKPQRIYTLSDFSSISDYCKKHNIRLCDYVLNNEDENFYGYMKNVWLQMKKSVINGLNDEGILPGGLEVVKKAKQLYEKQNIDETAQTKENRLVCSYAFAVSEQNASGETVVTSPTCGASGIVPAVLYYHQQKNGFNDDEIIKALMTAGLIGNLIKTNASISGAECGCQAEVGTACAMAAAALAELFELDIDKIEYAAEIAIEHHLGLTCDPICGLVQIPCIERNAVAAMRAINAVNLASLLWDTRKISFDRVVKTMKETGLDMHTAYKETSEGGLARININ